MLRFIQTVLKIFFLALIVKPGRPTSVDPLVCVNMTPENNPILSPEMYKSLIRVLDWDIGQREMMNELCKENNYLMQCLLVNGFNYNNLIECTGDKYIKVIQVYTAEFFKIKANFLSAIAGMVASKGYDEHDYIPIMNRLKKNLMDSLDQNRDPDLALASFEHAVTTTEDDTEQPQERRLLEEPDHDEAHELFADESESSEEDDFESSPEFKQMYEQLQNNYLIYVSLKKIVKGFVLTTIRCVQEYAEKAEVMVPADENIRLFNKTQLEESFPQEEMDRVFEERKELESETKDLVKKNGKSFNADLAKQGKYNHLVALHAANGNIHIGEMKISDSPEKIFKDSLLPKFGKNYLDRDDSEQVNLV